MPSIASRSGDRRRHRSRTSLVLAGPAEVIGRTLMPVVDQERILVGAVRRAAVLDDAQPPRGDLIQHAVVEQDHAVGDIFLDAVAGELAFAALAGDDRGDALVLQPARTAAAVRRAGSRCSSSPENSASIVSSTTRLAPIVRSHGRAGRTGLRGRIRRFPRSRAFDADVIDDDLPGLDQPLEVVAERGHIGARSCASPRSS